MAGRGNTPPFKANNQTPGNVPPPKIPPIPPKPPTSQQPASSPQNVTKPPNLQIPLPPKREPSPATSDNTIKAGNPDPSSHSTSLFASIFGTAMFANKWEKKMTEDRQTKILEMFTIPRNDPWDIYKQNSEIEIQSMIEHPYSKPLTNERVEMLHEIAINYDYGCQLDVIEAYRPHSFVSHESKDELNRLPTWLRFLILFRYDRLHAKFGHHTHHYIKLLANHIETRRTTTGTAAEHAEHEHDGPVDEDDVEETEILHKYAMGEEEIPSPSHQDIGEILGEDGEAPRKSFIDFEEAEMHRKQEERIEKSDLYKIKTAVWKWKLPPTLEQDWEPSNIHRAATTLRRALLTQPAAAEVAMVLEDEKLENNEKGILEKTNGEDEDEVEGAGGVGSDRFKKPAWEEVISHQAGFREQIAALVERDLHCIPAGLKKHEREEEERLASLIQTKKDAIIPPPKRKKTFMEKLEDSDFMRNRREMKAKKKDLEEKAPSRKYSNIWFKNCPMEPIKQAKRFPHHYRCDESFHAYVVELVGSSLFKSFIMLIIIANACSLAAETGETKNYHIIFDILDNFFLSVYLVEFMLKVYAHPYRYWTSGFNIFDCGILVVSLLNSIFVWIELDNIPELKLLVIFRALRILRGISMSVQIQVLITALVETLKTHVLSVLILLFLLMYITAIIAYYFFSSTPGLGDPWGNILKGMLRLFTFVTLDGWTDTSEEFEKAGYTHAGRVFCLICILLGNFLISNIFIAIIIMQISEATEAFRSRERDEREEIISVKKDIVFRRQKLDMRQLLAKQNLSSNADFYYLASQFLKLLRHDDLVEMNNIQFSPLWMDAFYKSIIRCHHTANVLMNLHRQMADNLLEMYRKNKESRYTVAPIRRSRYNRYMKLKSKLAILRQEFYRDLSSSQKKSNRPLQVKIGKSDPPQISKQLRELNERWQAAYNIEESDVGKENAENDKKIPAVTEELEDEDTKKAAEWKDKL